jgi:hypothetical protein
MAQRKDPLSSRRALPMDFAKMGAPQARRDDSRDDTPLSAPFTEERGRNHPFSSPSLDELIRRLLLKR